MLSRQFDSNGCWGLIHRNPSERGVVTAMLRIYESLSQKERLALDEMRAWAIGHGNTREQLSAKLAIAQRIIDSGDIGVAEVWKMNAVGVLFGDALKQAIGDKLAWVVAEDSSGRAYALSWKHTTVLIYPLSAIKSRMVASEPIDLQALFGEYSSIFPVQQT